MGKETEKESRGGRKIHQSHFSVGVIVPLKDGGYNTKYEWVDLGNGKLKLVRKKPKEFKVK